jgi:CheY-like chemotaxis protein
MSRVLLADDSPHAQRMGERILVDEGYEVVTVSDGDSAIIRLDDANPDVIVADALMPKRSGYDLCQYVRMSPRLRHTRVILTVGSQETLDDSEVKRVRADSVLRKPFEASALLEAVRPLMSKAVAERPEGGTETKQRAAAAAVRFSAPMVAVVDPEEVRAAVTLALDAAMPALIEEVTQRVLASLSSRSE